MKVAIVHDSLVEFGGAERVLNALLRIFPEADIYTALANTDFVRTRLPFVSTHHLHSSSIQPFPLETHTSLIQFLSPLIWRSFNLDSYDIVISHAAHLMSNLVRVNSGIHIAYIPSPPKNIAGIDPKTPLQNILPYTAVVKALYTKALRQTDRNLVNSYHTQRVLQKYFNVKSYVLYPQVDIPSRAASHGKGEYFLCVSRLDRGKNIELAIVACNKLGVRLKIVGKTNEPRYEQYLRSLAGPTVEFLGFLSDQELPLVYKHAIGFIFPSKNEDFGIAPLEAMAQGVPVIGFYAAGTKETVIEGETGTFFHQHTASSLQKALLKFRRIRFNPLVLQKRASEYDFHHFRRALLHHIAETRREKGVTEAKKQSR